MRNFARKYFNHVRINQVIQFMTYSDILMMSGWGLINPILAIFISEQVHGGTVILAGIASTTYLLIKSILQIPIARFIDLKRGEWDDYWVMIMGSLFIAASAFIFIFVTEPWHVIFAQVVGGIGGALSFPSWQAIFTRHIDKREEGLEWSVYFTAVDLGGALSAALGGFIAAYFGYKSLFVVVTLMSLLGTAFLAGITHRLKKSG